jgi:hypothetical protein
MKVLFLTISVLGLGFSLGACTPTVSDSAACKALGVFTSKDECQSLNAGVACEMKPISNASGSKTILCWAPSSGGQNTNGFATPTPSPGSCAGAAPAWTVGAWSPATCGPQVTQRTRTVTCAASCPCAEPQPETTSACTGDLYQGNHYESECKTWVGGGVAGFKTPVWGKWICKIHASQCPSGWTALKNASGVPYVQTSSASHSNDTGCGSNTVHTGQHLYLDDMLESATYCAEAGCTFGIFNGSCKSTGTFQANVTDVACY